MVSIEDRETKSIESLLSEEPGVVLDARTPACARTISWMDGMGGLEGGTLELTGGSGRSRETSCEGGVACFAGNMRLLDEVEDFDTPSHLVPLVPYYDKGYYT